MHTFPAPHTGRAQRLAALGRCLIDHLDTPLLVLDTLGTMLEANVSAMRRIAARQGLWQDAAGRIAVRSEGRWVPLSRYADDMAAGRTVTLPMDAADGTRAQITLQALTATDDGVALDVTRGGGWMLARIERPAAQHADALRGRFRFTRTQARVAELLCQGHPPMHAAQTLGIKLSTVRTHVGQLYEKTGTHSQAQLVALLHRN